MECIAQNIANAIEKEINKRTELSSGAKEQLQAFANKMKLVAEENAKLMQSKQNVQTSTTRTQTAKKDKPVGFTLTGTTFYTAKDQAKASIANAFIGYPHSKSAGSTGTYLLDAKHAGFPVNDAIKYDKDTVAFVSINGERAAKFGTDENTEYADNLMSTIARVADVLNAGGKIITDNKDNATRKYNKNGEGELREWLLNEGHVEEEHKQYSIWSKDGQAETTDKDVMDYTLRNYSTTKDIAYQKDDSKTYDAELDTKKDTVEMSPVDYVQSKIGDLVMPIEIVEKLEEKVLSKEALDKIVEMIKCKGNK